MLDKMKYIYYNVYHSSFFVPLFWRKGYASCVKDLRRDEAENTGNQRPGAELLHPGSCRHSAQCPPCPLVLPAFGYCAQRSQKPNDARQALPAVGPKFALLLGQKKRFRNSRNRFVIYIINEKGLTFLSDPYVLNKNAHR